MAIKYILQNSTNSLILNLCCIRVSIRCYFIFSSAQHHTAKSTYLCNFIYFYLFFFYLYIYIYRITVGGFRLRLRVRFRFGFVFGF